MHDMGKMKRAQELQIDEVSVQKLRESHETIQKLTSQLQEMQEQMNSMNDSGEFQEVESNNSGKLSYVSSQPAMIPSSRSLLSRDKRLPLDTWNFCLNHHNSNADICRKAVDNEFHNTDGISAEIYGWTAKTANIRVAIRQIPLFPIIFVLENTIQKPSDSLF